MAKWLDDGTLEWEDVSSSLAQDRFFSFFFVLNYKLLFKFVFVSIRQKLLPLAFRIHVLAHRSL